MKLVATMASSCTTGRTVTKERSSECLAHLEFLNLGVAGVQTPVITFLKTAYLSAKSVVVLIWRDTMIKFN